MGASALGVAAMVGLLLSARQYLQR